ncbi:2-dehydro-3-deoxy-D-gluconate 5-dehydrogenase KduD [Luteimicrobium subarcticum]|uniref:2-deoxy-D-gluconate 3-dehydrogenase n=1 Tax=Luteimicrobium subarcticum TaxID=620910 RepID=A0A2M8W1P0_9MICO|nr:2-dehydro-3-deoxy-D-gluconate 5-dehydrogenase KduD [Luteimicrobium subarcticum]PJI84847.1 2-deoxy-D-gluconate 3-dehydrogenase [Luteimicrobium subarcticum]
MPADLFRLDGRVALVTGASRGLGAGLARALADAGADVVCVQRSDDPTTLDAVRAAGRRAHLVTADLATATPTELEAVVDDAVTALGRLDVLVNNAGTIRRAPAAEHPTAWWDEVVAVNLDAVWHLSQAAGRHMLARGSGKILNIASMLSFQGGITVPGYAASKHAVLGLTRALANEWAARGVNVNAIAPGYMATDNTAALRDDADRADAISARIPAGRWGTPDDLAGAAVFLASDASAYVHGAVIPVDGGWLVR